MPRDQQSFSFSHLNSNQPIPSFFKKSPSTSENLSNVKKLKLTASRDSATNSIGNTSSLVFVNGYDANICNNIEGVNVVPDANGKTYSVYLILSQQMKNRSQSLTNLKTEASRQGIQETKPTLKSKSSTQLYANLREEKEQQIKLSVNAFNQMFAKEEVKSELKQREHFPCLIPNCVLNHKASQRTLKLAAPRKATSDYYMEKPSEISQQALSYTASQRIAKLAEPNRKAIRHDDRVNDKSISSQALSYVPTKRICQLAQPRPTFVDSVNDIPGRSRHKNITKKRKSASKITSISENIANINTRDYSTQYGNRAESEQNTLQPSRTSSLTSSRRFIIFRKDKNNVYLGNKLDFKGMC